MHMSTLQPGNSTSWRTPYLLSHNPREEKGFCVAANRGNLSPQTHIGVLWGVYRDNGKDNKNYYLGFRV